MKNCRSCKNEVSEDAYQCPKCGAPYPANPSWDGYGFEYKSDIQFAGLPLLHISFKYRQNRVPVPAVGIIAIGQFAAGFLTISQFGFGFLSLSQFSIGFYVIAQFAVAYSMIAQMGFYLEEGYGQLIKCILDFV
ncbi:MAG: zinc ribbon domain-containing protein [Verrucomicrobiota bacterium]|nr:zinc ribbon domain-containing protein [Verrucomicrobiota bacterium]